MVPTLKQAKDLRNQGYRGCKDSEPRRRYGISLSRAAVVKCCVNAGVMIKPWCWLCWAVLPKKISTSRSKPCKPFAKNDPTPCWCWSEPVPRIGTTDGHFRFFSPEINALKISPRIMPAPTCLFFQVPPKPMAMWCQKPSPAAFLALPTITRRRRNYLPVKDYPGSVRSNEEETFLETTKRFAEDPELRARLGQSGPDFVRKNARTLWKRVIGAILSALSHEAQTAGH